MTETIEHPDHYNKGKKMETWDWIEKGLTNEQFKGYLLGNVLKYLHRYDKKGGASDLDKAMEYIKKLKEFEYEEVIHYDEPAEK